MLKLLNFKRLLEQMAHRKIARSAKGFVPARISKKYAVATRMVQGKEIATMEHRGMAANDHLVFFHGGAYIFEAAPYHWQLAKKIMERHLCKATLVDYPLAPEYSYRDTFGMVEEAWDLLLREYPGDRFFFMGDSAGGGLALAFAQKLAQESPAKLPAGLILLSPWLDLTMSNPAVKDLERSDVILSTGMLRHAGSLYARGDDQHHYLLSPINGPFEGLPKTIVFYGTEELFHADCLNMKSIVSPQGNRFLFREYPGMQHDWALLPLPESALVVGEICSFLKE
jgi:monoterpene epsilon-lactone hydrolase